MKFRLLENQFLPVDRAQRIGRLLVLCALVGVLAGLGGAFFEVLVEWARHNLLDGLAGYRPPGPGGESELFSHTDTPFRPWVLAILPVVGGLLGGLVVFWLAPEAEGHGTDAAIDAYHNRRGLLRARVPIVKTIASAITLGTGGSAGREGPIAQIGAGFGSMMSRVLGLSVQERRMLMVAGMAAGIGAVFRAPLAGALFAAEVLYREMDMELEVIVPSVISSIVAYSVFTMFLGATPLFVTPHFSFDDPRQLFPYFVLALVVAAGARVFIMVFYGIRDRFKALKIPAYIKPMLGGVVVGSFALFLPEALASGYGLVQQAFTGSVSPYLLLAVVGGKIVTTSFTIGSGQSGGVFGPAMVIGGALGGALGFFFQHYFPEVSPPLGAFVVVGMAGFFASAANTPISTIIMVSEITGSYKLLVPSMWVCVIAFLLVRRSSLYEQQLPRRSDSPVHLGEMMGDVLERLSVRDALGDKEHEPTITVRSKTSIAEITTRFIETRHACFPVLDDDGKLMGVVDERALRQAIGTEGLSGFVVAADLIERAPLLTPEDSLHSAMHEMVTSHNDELVVVSPDDKREVVGSLSRRDLIAAYDHQIQKDLEEQASQRRWQFPKLPKRRA